MLRCKMAVTLLEMWARFSVIGYVARWPPPSWIRHMLPVTLQDGRRAGRGVVWLPPPKQDGGNWLPRCRSKTLSVCSKIAVLVLLVMQAASHIPNIMQILLFSNRGWYNITTHWPVFLFLCGDPFFGLFVAESGTWQCLFFLHECACLVGFLAVVDKFFSHHVT